MANVTVTAKHVKPLQGARCFAYDAGGAGNVGDVVYVVSDDDVEVTDASAAGTSAGIGVVVAAGTMGALTFAAGDRVSVCRFGPVAGFSGATPGALAYVSNDAGKVEDAAGDNSRVLGRMDSATVLFVNPPA